MGRTEPLIIDVFMAAFAGVGFHEKLAGNFLSPINLRGTGKEWPLGTITLAIHAGRRHRGILDASLILPTRLTQVTSGRAESGKDQQNNRAANDRTPDARRQPPAFP